jgi:hypothetical protein
VHDLRDLPSASGEGVVGCVPTRTLRATPCASPRCVFAPLDTPYTYETRPHKSRWGLRLVVACIGELSALVS